MGETTGEDGGARRGRPWRWWWVPVYFIGSTVLDEVLEATWNWLVAIGGYGTANAVVGLLALTLCFVFVQRMRVKQLKREAEGDPDPLPEPYDYETQAQAGFYGGWIVGVAAWTAGAVLLVFAGPAGPWVLGPIIGTTAVVAGRMELAHARVMDARRGRPPAPHG